MVVPEQISEWLRRVMQDPDVVGKEVASMIGCSRPTLYRALKGEVGQKTIRRMEKAFQTAASEPI